MKKIFQDKSVLIVGATGGLGNAAAQAFSSAGARLILAGRDAEKLQQLHQQFSVPVFQVDIANPESVEALKNSVTHVDVVVNLTGVDVRKPLDSYSIEEIQRLIAVNLAGSIYLTRVFRYCPSTSLMDFFQQGERGFDF